jgi:outer membrane immunogenic protein
MSRSTPNRELIPPPLSLVSTAWADPTAFLGSSSRTATGWTAGGGLEYALSNNISAKGEYLFTSLGGGESIRVVGSETNPVASPSSFTAAFNKTNFNVVRGGIDYKFGQ